MSSNNVKRFGFMSYENINPHPFLNTKKLMEIANVQILGSYQYNKGRFIFREPKSVLKLSALSLDDLIYQIKKYALNKSGVTTEVEYSNFHFYVKVKKDDLVVYITPLYDNILQPYLKVYEREKLLD